MRRQPVQNVRYPVFPLDRIQQLRASYCEYQRVSGVLERRRDAIVDAHLHSAIVSTGAVETKQQALNEDSIISINGIVHLLTYCSPFRQFAGEGGFRIGIVCNLASAHLRYSGDQCLHQQRQFSFVTPWVFLWIPGECIEPATESRSGIENEDSVPVSVAVGCDHAYSS